jgi:hypothetical protein
VKPDGWCGWRTPTLRTVDIGYITNARFLSRSLKACVNSAGSRTPGPIGWLSMLSHALPPPTPMHAAITTLPQNQASSLLNFCFHHHENSRRC